MGKTIIRPFKGRKFSSIGDMPYTKDEADRMAKECNLNGTEAFVKKKGKSDYYRVWQRCHQ